MLFLNYGTKLERRSANCLRTINFSYKNIRHNKGVLF